MIFSLSGLQRFSVFSGGCHAAFTLGVFAPRAELYQYWLVCQIVILEKVDQVMFSYLIEGLFFSFFIFFLFFLFFFFFFFFIFFFFFFFFHFIKKRIFLINSKKNRTEEKTAEIKSLRYLACRLMREKTNKQYK